MLQLDVLEQDRITSRCGGLSGSSSCRIGTASASVSGVGASVSGVGASVSGVGASVSGVGATVSGVGAWRPLAGDVERASVVARTDTALVDGGSAGASGVPGRVRPVRAAASACLLGVAIAARRLVLRLTAARSRRQQRQQWNNGRLPP